MKKFVYGGLLLATLVGSAFAPSPAYAGRVFVGIGGGYGPGYYRSWGPGPYYSYGYYGAPAYYAPGYYSYGVYPYAPPATVVYPSPTVVAPAPATVTAVPAPATAAPTPPTPVTAAAPSTPVTAAAPSTAPANVDASPTSPTYTNAQGQTCREYQASSTIGGTEQQTYGTACLQPDGTWHVISAQ